MRNLRNITLAALLSTNLTAAYAQAPPVATATDNGAKSAQAGVAAAQPPAAAPECPPSEEAECEDYTLACGTDGGANFQGLLDVVYKNWDAKVRDPTNWDCVAPADVVEPKLLLQNYCPTDAPDVKCAYVGDAVVAPKTTTPPPSAAKKELEDICEEGKYETWELGKIVDPITQDAPIEYRVDGNIRLANGATRFVLKARDTPLEADEACYLPEMTGGSLNGSEAVAEGQIVEQDLALVFPNAPTPALKHLKITKNPNGYLGDHTTIEDIKLKIDLTDEYRIVNQAGKFATEETIPLRFEVATQVGETNYSGLLTIDVANTNRRPELTVTPSIIEGDKASIGGTTIYAPRGSRIGIDLKGKDADKNMTRYTAVHDCGDKIEDTFNPRTLTVDLNDKSSFLSKSSSKEECTLKFGLNDHQTDDDWATTKSYTIRFEKDPAASGRESRDPNAARTAGERGTGDFWMYAGPQIGGSFWLAENEFETKKDTGDYEGVLGFQTARHNWGQARVQIPLGFRTGYNAKQFSPADTSNSVTTGETGSSYETTATTEVSEDQRLGKEKPVFEMGIAARYASPSFNSNNENGVHLVVGPNIEFHKRRDQVMSSERTDQTNYQSTDPNRSDVEGYPDTTTSSDSSYIAGGEGLSKPNVGLSIGLERYIGKNEGRFRWGAEAELPITPNGWNETGYSPFAVSAYIQGQFAGGKKE